MTLATVDLSHVPPYELEVGPRDADFESLTIRLQRRYPAADWVGPVFVAFAIPSVLLSCSTGLGSVGKRGAMLAAAIGVAFALACTAVVRLFCAGLARLALLRRPRDEEDALRKRIADLLNP